jgi:hypothetical protein
VYPKLIVYRIEARTGLLIRASQSDTQANSSAGVSDLPSPCGCQPTEKQDENTLPCLRKDPPCDHIHSTYTAPIHCLLLDIFISSIPKCPKALRRRPIPIPRTEHIASMSLTSIRDYKSSNIHNGSRRGFIVLRRSPKERLWVHYDPALDDWVG